MIVENYLQELFDKKDIIEGKMYLVYYDSHFNGSKRSGCVMIFKHGHISNIYRVVSYKTKSTPKPSDVPNIILALLPCNEKNHPWLKKSNFFGLEFIDDLMGIKSLFKYDLDEKSTLYIYEPGVKYEEEILKDIDNITYVDFDNGKLFKDTYTKVFISENTTVLIPKKVKPEKIHVKK